MTRSRIPVAVLGATGSVGQRFLALLADHPWFEPAVLTASDRSAGLPYRDAVRWLQASPIPPALAGRVLAPTSAEAVAGCRVAFSALDAAVAGPLEDELARAGLLVVSNTKTHRMDPDVPLLVPEVNGDHLALAAVQGRGEGRILTNPNCSTIGLVLALKPLDDAFGVETAHVVTMQAVSGAGIPGVASMQAIDNVIPFIGGEEEKIEIESRKILGRLENGRIAPHPIRISAACNRVPVIDGHTLCVSVGLREKPDLAAVRSAWDAFPGLPGLPSAPERPVVYLDGDDVPQPRLHRDTGAGMSATVGRLRPDPLFDVKFVVLSHNTVRGAAGGAVLVAEMAIGRR